MAADLMSCEVWNQCGACFEASEQQYNQWFKRVGRNRSMWSLVIDDMHERAHAEALAEDSERDDMAEKEIVAQIDKLRKTRPARAVEAMAGNYSAASEQLPMLAHDLTTALTFLLLDLKDEARLVEQAKLRGGTSIVKDRLAVAGWLELFVVQLGREPGAPPVEREPAPDRTEPVTSHEALNAFVSDMAAQGRGELVAGDMLCPGHVTSDESTWDAHTWLGPMSAEIKSNRWRCADPVQPEQVGVTDYLSGASDELFATVPGIQLAGALVGTSNDIPGAAEYVATLPNGSMTIDAAAYIGDALAPVEQATHDTIDRELAHVTADPIVDPFVPIPRTVWAPAVPPNGAAWTSADLLAPVDAASLPAHLSFSQATTAVECGAKYRMQRIAQIPQVPQWANVGGKAFHACVENFEIAYWGAGGSGPGTQQVEIIWRDFFEREIAKTEQASGMTREQFRASGQGREGYDWWRVEGAAMLQRYVDWRQGAGAGQQLLSGPSGAPMLEWETTYAVDGVSFKTILDSVWTTAGPPYAPEVSAVIRDWKTGSMTPDNRQLCTQAWGLRKAGWQGPILVQFFDARKGTFSEPFDPFDAEQGGMSWEDVRYFVLSADAQRHLPVLPARPSDFCGGCSVAYACPIMSQRKAPKAATK